LFSKGRENFVVRKFGAIVSLAAAVLITSPAMAWDWWVDTKITVVEPDYVPTNIVIQVSSAGGTCAAGAFLNYVPSGSTSTDKQANISSVLSAMLTAQARGTTVRIYGSNSGCVVNNIWIMN
jgi:hypothetical protein